MKFRLPLPKEFFSYIHRNVTRARLRSSLTIFGVTVGMIVFGFVRAMDSGLAEVEKKVSEDKVLLVYERNTF